MSLGTIHPNLYKSDAKEVKAPFRIASNLNIFNKQILFLASFLILSSILVSYAFAAHIVQVKVDDGTDRVVGTESTGVTLRFNISNQAGSITITSVNITNATGYIVSSTQPSCTINQLSVNCTGLSIAAGSNFLVNLTVATPAAGSSGAGTWTVITGTASDSSSNTVYTLAVDLGQDIGFDLNDELNNVTNVAGAAVDVKNTTTTGPKLTNGYISRADSDNDGLVIFEFGTDISGDSGSGTYLWNVSKTGFVNATNSSGGQSYSRSGSAVNGVRASVNYGIKITVQDELGNAITDATVNITSPPPSSNFTQGPINSTINANATVGGVYYFALPQAVTSNFTNVTAVVTRSGYLTNGSATGTYFMVFPGTPVAGQGSQATGNSPYKLPFTLKLNVTDELGVGGAFRNTSADITIILNNTVSTANRTDPNNANIYYFAIPAGGVNVSVAKPGYITRNITEQPLNSTTQASLNPQLLFRLKITVRDEIGGLQGFGSGVTITFNGTAITANATSGSSTYYSNSTASALNISAARAGYINTSVNEQPLNATTQANVTITMPFSIKVIGICNELGSAGHCFTIDGTDSAVEVSGNGNRNSTYSGNASYINATNGVTPTTITLNASKNGYVNRSITIITNDTTQALVMFNTTGGTGTTDRATGLLFTVRVLGVFDELGIRNFTLDGTTAAIDVGSGQITNVFYSGPRAYANATGTSAVDIIAYMVNQSYINETQSATPSASYQQTILYNRTNQTTNQVNITDEGLKFTIRINVQDERGQTTNMGSGVTVALNNTDYTADSTSGTSYFFTNRTGAVPGAMNVTVARSGYINTSSGGAFPAGHPINQTTQVNLTISLPFTARFTVTNELGTNLTASDVTFYANNSVVNASANFTDSVFAYFAFSPGAIFVNATRPGYVDNGTIYVNPINASTQATTRNIVMNFTVVVISICDELNVTCLTIDGSTAVVNSGGAEATGTTVGGRGVTNSTTYSGGRAYINATNATNINVTAFGDGFINRTGTGVTPNAANQTRVIFNTSSLTNSHVNASALLFSIRVISVCDQLNFTCMNINGSIDKIGYAATEVGGNVTRYNSGRGYIAVLGTGPGRTPVAITINASSVGYINATNSTVSPNVNSQVDVIFNASTTPLNYSVKLTLVDELGQTANMGSAVTLHVNLSTSTSTLTENVSFFRSSPSSNIYFINATYPGSINITAKRDGYINTTYGGVATTSVNQTVQGTPAIRMPFSVKVNTGSVTGVTATVLTGSTSFSAADGNSTTDTNSTKDGFIYWALNQTTVVGATGVGTVDLQINKPNYVTLTFDDVSLNYSTQLSVSPTMVRSNADDTVAPAITITSPSANSNVTTTTPVISFLITDNDGGSGIETSSIAVNVSGFNFTRDCITYNSLNISCSYTTNALTDSANTTIRIGANDNAGNLATNATRNFGVNSAAGVTAGLNTSDTSAIADNTFANGWSFTFNITLGSTTSNATSVNATAVKIANWARIGGSETIPTAGNTIMNYTDASSTRRTYYVSHDYNTTDTIYPLQDLDTASLPINGTVTIFVKIPAATLPGTYSTTFTFGSWSVAMTGGNPT